MSALYSLGVKSTVGYNRQSKWPHKSNTSTYILYGLRLLLGTMENVMYMVHTKAMLENLFDISFVEIFTKKLLLTINEVSNFALRKYDIYFCDEENLLDFFLYLEY